MGSLVPTNLSLYIAIRTSYYFGRVFLVLLADVLIIVSWGSCLQWTHQFLVSYFVHSFQRMIVPLDIQGRWGLYRLGLRATSMVKGPKTHLMATLMNIDIDDRLSNLGATNLRPFVLSIAFRNFADTLLIWRKGLIKDLTMHEGQLVGGRVLRLPISFLMDDSATSKISILAIALFKLGTLVILCWFTVYILNTHIQLVQHGSTI